PAAVNGMIVCGNGESRVQQSTDEVEVASGMLAQTVDELDHALGLRGGCVQPPMDDIAVVARGEVDFMQGQDGAPSSGCSRSERDSMQSCLQPTQLLAEVRVRSGDVDVGCDGVDRQRQNGAGGKAPFLAPRRQLFAAAGVDDSPEPDPCMGCRAH